MSHHWSTANIRTLLPSTCVSGAKTYIHCAGETSRPYSIECVWVGNTQLTHTQVHTTITHRLTPRGQFSHA